MAIDRPPSSPQLRSGSSSTGGIAWAEEYLKVRAKEGRLYSDSLLAHLPNTPDTHPLAAEWRMRADSARRLVRYLRHLPRPLRVVEVGCGNGWLSNAIARIDASEVVGIDGNPTELRQASRVFSSTPNLRFVLGDATAIESPLAAPNVIVLASAIQYVSDLRAFLERLLSWLAPGGEVLVLDSPLYAADELSTARARTRLHYERLGVPEMIGRYHHHSWTEFAGFGVDVLYRPEAVRSRLERTILRRSRAPFPFIRVTR